jgi:hypothetical protein
MKRKNFYINLYILIPIIFSGITILGVIVAYQLTGGPDKTSWHLPTSIYILALSIGCISFLFGFFILRLLLKP